MKSWRSGKRAQTRQSRRLFVSDRSRNAHLVRETLERDGYPRLQMSLIVALTGGAGSGFSYGLGHGPVRTRRGVHWAGDGP